MAKSFKQQTDQIEKAIGKFIEGAKNRSVICLVCNSKGYRAFTVAKGDKERLKKEELLIRSLVADRELFNRFFRIVKPAERFYRNEARRKAKEAQQDANKGQSAGI